MFLIIIYIHIVWIVSCEIHTLLTDSKSRNLKNLEYWKYVIGKTVIEKINLVLRLLKLREAS